tara:strand:+ start:186780 stop:187472 length:693 start_codon:yes stop_codon:yes gene_type:complete
VFGRCVHEKNLVVTALASAVACSGVAQADESWPDLFREAVGDFDGQDEAHRYDMSVVSGDGDMLFRYSFDPMQATPLQIEERSEEISEEDILEGLSDDEGDIWCDGMQEQVLGNVALVSEDEATATFTYTPTTRPDADSMERQVVERTVATAVVDKATRQISSFSYHLPQSFKPIIVARVHTFDLNGTCVAGPSGRRFISEMTVSIDISAMGSRHTETTIQRVENVEAVR